MKTRTNNASPIVTSDEMRQSYDADYEQTMESQQQEEATAEDLKTFLYQFRPGRKGMSGYTRDASGFPMDL
jgi:hypothetical protein